MVVGTPFISLLLPWLCGVGLMLPCCSELLVLIFFLICHLPSLGLSFPIHAVREGQGDRRMVPGLLGRMARRLSQFSASWSSYQLHTPPLCLCHCPHATITAPFGWWSSKPAPQHSLARKQVSELSPGWKGTSIGANCRASRRGWEEAARERNHLVMRQLLISWDIIAGLPSRLLEVPGLPLVNQR